MRSFRTPVAILCLALAQAAQAQAIGQATSYSVSSWRVVTSLLLCLALGAAAIYALRRRYGLGRLPLLGNEPPRRIKVIEQQPLGPQRSVCLIEIDGRSYAALFAPQAATLIAVGAETATPPETMEVVP